MPNRDPAKNREAVRKHYYAHKDYYIEKNRRASRRKGEYIRSLRERPCTDCGVEYPYYIMEFDHLGDKFLPISRMLTRSWKLIEAEIAKCEVVCANCHRARTHHRRLAGVTE